MFSQGKRGIEKPPFDLPEFIKKTGIMEMRETVQNQVSLRLFCILFISFSLWYWPIRARKFVFTFLQFLHLKTSCVIIFLFDWLNLIVFQEGQKTLKAQMRERVRPKLGKMDIDYQKLHDAFFRYCSSICKLFKLCKSIYSC